MIEFVCTPLPVRSELRVAILTMQFHMAQMCLFLRKGFFFHSEDPSKQFGTNAKLSWCCKVGQIKLCGIGYPISVLI